eukprot:jgi/Chlat1/2517/Chrsp175S00142
MATVVASSTPIIPVTAPAPFNLVPQPPTDASTSQPAAARVPLKRSPGAELVFVYGTLKRGFFNHYVLQRQMARGGAVFIGTAFTKHAYPMVLPGPFHVPFLLNVPNQGHRIPGEVYAVDKTALAALDEKEGVHYNYYTRANVEVTELQPHTREGEALARLYGGRITAGVYFEAGVHTPRLSQLPPIESYDEEHVDIYVPRQKRPPNCCFTGSIGQWLDQQCCTA